MVDRSAKVNRVETSANSDIDEPQLYYWTREWQGSEKQARADIQAGRVTKLNGIDEVDAHFGQLAKRRESSGNIIATILTGKKKSQAIRKRFTPEEMREIIGDPQKFHASSEEFRKTEDLFCTPQYYKLLEKYPDQWVAATGGKVEAHGDSYEAVLEMVREKGLPRDAMIIQFIATDPIPMIL